MIETLLRDLVKIPSETGNEAELALFCEAFLQQAGFKTQRQFISPERFNLLAEKGEGSWSLLLSAHLDTVPAAPGWIHPPLELQTEGDRLSGLGSSDMLAGAAIILQAAAASKPIGYRLKLALTVDEEAWSRGAWQLVQSDFCHDIAGVIVPELTIDSESEVLGLGRMGHTALLIHCYGPRQHAALASNQASAIEQAAQIISALKTFPLLESEDLGKEHLMVRKIHAEADGLTTPDTCTLELSYFTLPEHPEENILTELNDFLNPFHIHYELSVAPRPTPSPVAYQIDVHHPFVGWVQDICEQELGHPLAIAFGHSVADENILATQLRVPVVSLAPVGGRSHQAGEWVSKSSMQRILKLYSRLLDTAGAQR